MLREDIPDLRLRMSDSRLSTVKPDVHVHDWESKSMQPLNTTSSIEAFSHPYHTTVTMMRDMLGSTLFALLFFLIFTRLFFFSLIGCLLFCPFLLSLTHLLS